MIKEKNVERKEKSKKKDRMYLKKITDALTSRQKLNNCYLLFFFFAKFTARNPVKPCPHI